MEKEFKVDKINSQEIKITLPEGMSCEVPDMTIQELYHALTDQLVPLPHHGISRGCVVQIN